MTGNARITLTKQLLNVRCTFYTCAIEHIRNLCSLSAIYNVDENQLEFIVHYTIYQALQVNKK